MTYGLEAYALLTVNKPDYSYNSSRAFIALRYWRSLLNQVFIPITMPANSQIPKLWAMLEATYPPSRGLLIMKAEKINIGIPYKRTPLKNMYLFLPFALDTAQAENPLSFTYNSLLIIATR